LRLNLLNGVVHFFYRKNCTFWPILRLALLNGVVQLFTEKLHVVANFETGFMQRRCSHFAGKNCPFWPILRLALLSGVVHILQGKIARFGQF
jgi:hypothetical protein